MTDIRTYVPRQAKVRAMRIILGTTTQSEILEFCPTANVGTLYQDGKFQETDIRWLVLSDGSAQMQEDGDWLLQLPSGRYDILSDTEFHLRYEAERSFGTR